MKKFEAILNKMISTSIQKLFVSNTMVHDYWITKHDLNRQRVTEKLVSNCEGRCYEREVICEYVKARKAFNIRIDLKLCRLTLSQKAALSNALAAAPRKAFSRK